LRMPIFANYIIKKPSWRCSPCARWFLIITPDLSFLFPAPCCLLPCLGRLALPHPLPRADPISLRSQATLHSHIWAHTNSWTAPSSKAKALPKSDEQLPGMARTVYVAILLHSSLQASCLVKTEWTTGHPKTSYLHIKVMSSNIYIMCTCTSHTSHVL
jgi:hypothetical protein